MSDPKPLDWAVLSQLLGGWPYRVEGQWYHRQSISLDGYEFVKCHFDECTLFTTKGSFRLDHCKVSSCSVRVDGEAWRIVRLYNWVAPQALKEALARWPSVLPLINTDDQTISIP